MNTTMYEQSHGSAAIPPAARQELCQLLSLTSFLSLSWLLRATTWPAAEGAAAVGLKKTTPDEPQLLAKGPNVLHSVDIVLKDMFWEGLNRWLDFMTLKVTSNLNG